MFIFLDEIKKMNCLLNKKMLQLNYKLVSKNKSDGTETIKNISLLLHLLYPLNPLDIPPEYFDQNGNMISEDYNKLLTNKRFHNKPMDVENYEYKVTNVHIPNFNPIHYDMFYEVLTDPNKNNELYHLHPEQLANNKIKCVCGKIYPKTYMRQHIITYTHKDIVRNKKLGQL